MWFEIFSLLTIELARTRGVCVCMYATPSLFRVNMWWKKISAIQIRKESNARASIHAKPQLKPTKQLRGHTQTQASTTKNKNKTKNENYNNLFISIMICRAFQVWAYKTLFTTSIHRHTHEHTKYKYGFIWFLFCQFRLNEPLFCFDLYTFTSYSKKMWALWITKC